MIKFLESELNVPLSALRIYSQMVDDMLTESYQDSEIELSNITSTMEESIWSHYLDFTRDKFNYEQLLKEKDGIKNLETLIKFYGLRVNPGNVDWKYYSITSPKIRLPFSEPSRLIRQLMILSEHGYNLEISSDEMNEYLSNFFENNSLRYTYQTLTETKTIELNHELFFKMLLDELNLWSSIYQDKVYHNAYRVLVGCLSKVFFLWRLPINLSDFLIQFKKIEEYIIIDNSDISFFIDMGLQYIKYLDEIPTMEYSGRFEDSLGYTGRLTYPIKIKFNNVQNNLLACRQLIAKINKSLYSYYKRILYQLPEYRPITERDKIFIKDYTEEITNTPDIPINLEIVIDGIHVWCHSSGDIKKRNYNLSFKYRVVYS